MIQMNLFIKKEVDPTDIETNLWLPRVKRGGIH